VLRCLGLLALASAPVLASMLPESLGEYRRGRLTSATIPTNDRDILSEYGLRTTEHAEFTSANGHRFVADALQFSDSEGAHAAYLWLRPANGAPSPLGGTTSELGGSWGETSAIVGGAVTVVGRKNYVFCFRGGAPTRSALNDILNHLSDMDSNEPRPDGGGAYFVAGSDRILLGPASLAKLVPRIPPSIAGFHLGAKGRTAHFETSSGPMMRTIFEYPSGEAALERVTLLKHIPGAFVRIEGRSVGVILDPPDRETADELLHGIDYIDNQSQVIFDPICDGDVLTFEGGINTVLAGWVVGLLLGIPRYLVRWHSGIPGSLLRLHISSSTDLFAR